MNIFTYLYKTRFFLFNPIVTVSFIFGQKYVFAYPMNKICISYLNRNQLNHFYWYR